MSMECDDAAGAAGCLSGAASESPGGWSVGNYGWSSAEAPCSCGYIFPGVLSILRRLGVRRVADLGAGNGRLCGELSLAGFQVVGVEQDGEGCDIARASYPSLKFYNHGLQDDPSLLLAGEEKFDAVVSTEVVEHLYSPHLLPRYAGALLNEGGYLVLSTPYHGYLKNLAIALLGKWDSHHTTLWHGGHVKFWSRATLSALLRENGFRVVGFSGVGRFPLLWKSMIVVGQRL
jgi:2-polyprenyl-3-methyl-5-hydroxy-6-metoxy-1,4-benzoquinol methylase